MIFMTNGPYELPLDKMKNITTEISDEQNLALSIKLNGAIVVPAVKHTVRISYYAAYHPWAETLCCLHYCRNCFSNDWNNNNYWSNRRPKWHKKTVAFFRLVGDDRGFVLPSTEAICVTFYQYIIFRNVNIIFESISDWHS